jgi:hypothetical protein
MLEGIRLMIRHLVMAVRRNARLVSIPPESPMDSDCISVFLARLLKKAGCRVRFKVVKQPTVAEFHHIYVEVWYPDAGRWLPLDPHQCDDKKFDKRVNVNI